MYIDRAAHLNILINISLYLVIQLKILNNYVYNNNYIMVTAVLTVYRIKNNLFLFITSYFKMWIGRKINIICNSLHRSVD